MIAAKALVCALVAQTVPGDEPNQGGEVSLESADPAVALARLHPAKGYRVELFASERDFPIGNPVAIAFDARGRLWVATMPTYPQVVPGVPPSDKIVILEDTDGDGRADRHVVFADGLYLPGGFELGDGGAYVAQQPNIVFLRDTDGDDVADERETILHGFGTEDSHHAISAFTWDPGGGLYFQEGTFHHTQVETPYGPVRCQDAGVFRYEPLTERFRVFVSYAFANPWGHVFDRWGQNFIADASGGANYFGTALTGRIDYPRKHPGMKVMTSVVRPTCGIEIVSSRQFPDEGQGDLLVNNCIGFQGIKRHRLKDEGSGFASDEVEPLLFSSDRNFRPVDLEFGPDGALFVADWWNPLIGHMQYSVRDPRRDHARGRIWRIVAEGRPLVSPKKIAGEPLERLFALLREPEDRTRYRVRLEIRLRPADAVRAALAAFVAGLSDDDPERERLLLEALWVTQGIDAVDAALLERVLASPEPRARAAATRVLRYWIDRVPGSLARLRKLANDPHPRVRLEAVLALSDFREPAAAEAALEVLRHETDYYIDYTLGETILALEPEWKAAVLSGSEKPFAAGNAKGLEYLVARLDTAELARAARSDAVLAALLERPGVDDETRLEALSETARRRGTAAVDVLIAALRHADAREDGHADHVGSELGRILARLEPTALARARAAIAGLAELARRPVVRRHAIAALVSADGAPEIAFRSFSSDARRLEDFLGAVPLFARAADRAALFDEIGDLAGRIAHGGNGSAPPPALPRFVRIELPGTGRTLTLAEVEAYSGGVNVAPSGRATQSSVAWNGEASRAIDGKKSGRYGDDGQTHTIEGETAPWWELDLLAERAIDELLVWNRTEEGGKFAKRLDGFTVTLLDASRRPVFERKDVPAPQEVARFEVDTDPVARIRGAAMAALATIEGREADAIAAIAPKLRDGISREAAIRALATLPRERFSRDAAASIVEGILAWVSELSADAASAPDVQDGIRLASDLAAVLPDAEAARVRDALAARTLAVFIVRPIPHEMLFDVKEIVVEALKPVRIVFENGDIMPHNFLVVAPGSLAEVGIAAEAMASDPAAYAKGFVPDTDKVLFGTRLLDPGTSETISFEAPEAPGEYPFVCTFPGHWTRMNGILRVVGTLEPEAPRTIPTRSGAAAASLASARPFVKNWKIEDVEPELHRVSRGRSRERGRRVFEEASCVKCHRVESGAGGSGGPDLSEVAKKYTRSEILRELLAPSRVLNEEFRSFVVTTRDERVLTGVLASQDARAIRLRPNLFEPDEIVEIARADVVSALPATVSMMPESLLVTFDLEEILDLLSFVEGGG